MSDRVVDGGCPTRHGSILSRAEARAREARAVSWAWAARPEERVREDIGRPRERGRGPRSTRSPSGCWSGDLGHGLPGRPRRPAPTGPR
ncbi:hypothetical protein AB0N50_14695 [Streptomyces pharetrae]|uniref:hypothetical protein n=1 Tax=Streptomyces pharetrae TaxID=291370 RepID=UPI003460A6CB